MSEKNFVTKDYCNKCQEDAENQRKALEKLFNEKLKSIKNYFVIGFTLTTLIISAIQIVISMWR